MKKFFFKGEFDKYNPSEHANGFYVSTDTNLLIAGGITVGEDPERMQAIEDFMDSKGLPNGLASLDENGKVPVSQVNGELARVVGLEKFVNARTELDSLSPVNGDKYYVIEDKKIYTYTDAWDAGQTPHSDTIYNHRLADDEGRTNILYRWDGATMVEISASLALGEVTGTAYEGSKGKANADAIDKLQEDLTYVADTVIPQMNANTAAALDMKVSWDSEKKVISLPADGSISALRNNGVEGGVLVAQRTYDEGATYVTELGTTKNKLTLNTLDGVVKVDYPDGSKTVAYAEDVPTNAGLQELQEQLDALEAEVGDPGDGETTQPTGIYKIISDDETTTANALNQLNTRTTNLETKVGESSVADQIQAAIDALKGGVSTEYDTLKKIEDLLKAGDANTLSSANTYTDESLTWYDVE